MRYPLGANNQDFLNRFYNAQEFGTPTSYGFHEGELPFLKFGIFPVITSSVYFLMAGITNSFNILYDIVVSIFIKMMGYKTSFFTFIGSTTKFASVFPKRISNLMRNAIFPIIVFLSRPINSYQRLNDIFYSFRTHCLTMVRAVLIHSSSPHFISWRNKLFITMQTIKNKLTFFSPNKISLGFSLLIGHNNIISRSTKEYI